MRERLVQHVVTIRPRRLRGGYAGRCSGCTWTATAGTREGVQIAAWSHEDHKRAGYWNPVLPLQPRPSVAS